MKRESTTFIFIVFIHISSVFSQTTANNRISIDTLKSSYSISGELNKVDFLSGPSMNSISWFSSNPWLMNPMQFLYSSNPFQLEKKSQNIRYTSLPHIGFNYSFGASGYQNAVLKYTQCFPKDFLVNIDFKNFLTNGILRNSGYKNQDIQIKILKKWKKIDLYFDVNSINRTFKWNGGVTNDSLPLTYSLGLIPVQKPDALSVRKDVTLFSKTNFNLISDSVQRFGISIKNQFDSQNRVYTETGNLASIYPTILVDSFETRDHLQMSIQKNELTFFLEKQHLNLELGVEQTFWNYRNSNIYRDTLELALLENICFGNKNFRIGQKFEYYLVGRNGNWKNEVSLHKKSEKWDISSYWKLENSLPDLFQRHYFSNSLFYQLPVYENQIKTQFDLNFSYSLSHSKIRMNASYIYLKNPYFFNGQSWVNSLYNQVNALNAAISIDYKHKCLSFNPNYTICILPSQFNFYPTHNLSVRLIAQGGIFKNRKLKTYIGLEPRLIGNYAPISIIPSMDLFLLSTANTAQSEYLDLAFFMGFELNEFKFFARAENLGYFWNNRMLQVMKGYPIPPMQIKLGITWDFWN